MSRCHLKCAIASFTISTLGRSLTGARLGTRRARSCRRAPLSTRIARHRQDGTREPDQKIAIQLLVALLLNRKVPRRYVRRQRPGPLPRIPRDALGASMGRHCVKVPFPAKSTEEDRGRRSCKTLRGVGSEGQFWSESQGFEHPGGALIMTIGMLIGAIFPRSGKTYGRPGVRRPNVRIHGCFWSGRRRSNHGSDDIPVGWKGETVASQLLMQSEAVASRGYWLLEVSPW